MQLSVQGLEPHPGDRDINHFTEVCDMMVQETEETYTEKAIPLIAAAEVAESSPIALQPHKNNTATSFCEDFEEELASPSCSGRDIVETNFNAQSAVVNSPQTSKNIASDWSSYTPAVLKQKRSKVLTGLRKKQFTGHCPEKKYTSRIKKETARKRRCKGRGTT